MIRFCLRDDSSLKVIGTMKTEIFTPDEAIDQQLVVRRCPGCGKITFWDDYEELKEGEQRLLKVMQ